MGHNLFKHLVEGDDSEFIELSRAPISAVVEGQANTAEDLLRSLDPDVEISDADLVRTRSAFVTLTDPKINHVEKVDAVLELKVPAAVKHLAGMLTQYDWDYVNQAKQIRAYVVSELLETSANPDPKVKLQAPLS